MALQSQWHNEVKYFFLAKSLLIHGSHRCWVVFLAIWFCPEYSYNSILNGVGYIRLSNLEELLYNLKLPSAKLFWQKSYIPNKIFYNYNLLKVFTTEKCRQAIFLLNSKNIHFILMAFLCIPHCFEMSSYPPPFLPGNMHPPPPTNQRKR